MHLTCMTRGSLVNKLKGVRDPFRGRARQFNILAYPLLHFGLG